MLELDIQHIAVHHLLPKLFAHHEDNLKSQLETALRLFNTG